MMIIMYAWLMPHDKLIGQVVVQKEAQEGKHKGGQGKYDE